MGQHLGISKPFIFYVGNVDYRKNMHGAIQAFAKLPSPLRRSHQLVLNAVAGWWWADPVAALGVAALAAVEGVRTWRADSLTDTCCA